MDLPFFKKRTRDIRTNIFESGIITALDIIAPSSIEITQDYLKLGDRWARSYFIFSFPRYLNTGWFSPIINLDVPMDISFFIHPAETEHVLKQLRRKVTEVQSEIIEREEKGLIRDPVLETAYQDLEVLRDRLQTAQERMFRFGIYLTVYAESYKELREIEMTLRSILESRLIYIKPSLFQQKEGFLATSPYGIDTILVHTTMNTDPLSSAFPFISFDLSSNEGILYGINKHNNSLILFDRFSLENANEVFFGKAGSGKSVAADTPVLIREKKQTKLTKIGSLIEGLIKEKGAVQIDDEMEGVIEPKMEVYTFNKELKGEWAKVKIAARKKAPADLYGIRTASGRRITITGDHNIVSLKNGKVNVVKGSELKGGEFIPLPRFVAETAPFSKSFNLLELFKFSEGVYVADAADLIRNNYKILKQVSLDKKFDLYLYKYRDGRVIPLKYFLKILKYLGIKPQSQELKQIKIVSRNGKKKCSPDIDFKITPEFLRLAGYICSEGTVRNDLIIITNEGPEILSDIDYCLRKLGFPFFYANRGIVIDSRLFIELIKALDGKGYSNQKKILPFIFDLPKDKTKHYLAAYFEGDGGVESNSVVAVSKSKKLISEISYLLLSFGIIGRISKTRKKATNANWKRKKVYWKISISGQDNLQKFANDISFISNLKKERLKKITNKIWNTNVDVIPGLASVFEEIYQLFGVQLHDIPEISEWKRNKRNPSPRHLKEVINKIEERIKKFKDLSSSFEILAKLPSLATVINFGTNDKNFNRDLWKVLGQSWRLMKKEEVKSDSNNVLTAIQVTTENSYSLNEIKSTIHKGFKEMDLSIKHFNPCLQSALIQRAESDTAYETIHKTAAYISASYKGLLSKIPLVEEKLAQLKILADSNLFWDPIVEIRKIKNKKEKYVYDLTVDNEVFLAGEGGMFIHNSYCQKLEILRSLMTGIDVIVIDPENEYQVLADAVGGSYFKISLTSPHHVNPFDLPIPREDERPEDVLRSNIINLVGLLRIMMGGLTPEEDAIIDRALTETYAAKDITPESDFSRITPPLMSDFEQVLETMEGGESLVRRIRKFTMGTFSGFFNQPSNITMDNKFVVFGIRDMEEELKPMAMFIILRYIWNTVRSQLKKRILVVDEAWWLMQSDDGASFLYGIAKRGRKYWLGVTTITQDVIDFMKSTYGQPIINNSSIQLLMKQSPAAIDLVQKTFNLTEEEKYLLLEAAVGEGLFFAGQKHVAIRVVASYAEDQIVTTAPEEILKIKRAKEELAE